MWTLPRRFAFRFFCVYVLLDSIPWPLGAIPGTGFARTFVAAVGNRVVPWFGRHALGIDQPITRLINGSGDTLFHWVALAAILACALLIAIAWSALDRRDDETAFRWLRVYVRLVLASSMLEFGIIKVLGGQFPPVSGYRLVQPLGLTSPMSLLWTTMGFSPAYQAFGGACELAAGLLLLWGRTAGAGGLLCVAVMSNVVMMNFCFDIPVKILSSRLLLYSLFITLPLLPSVAKALLGRATTPVDLRPPPFVARWKRFAATAAVLIATATALLTCVDSGIATARWVARAPPSLAGAWRVEEHAGGSTRRWRTLAVSNWGAATIYWSDDTVDWVRLTDNPVRSEMTLAPRDGRGAATKATYAKTDETHLVVRASLGTETAVIKLRKLREDDFELVSRGFHWVNDSPFSR